MGEGQIGTFASGTKRVNITSGGHGIEGIYRKIPVPKIKDERRFILAPHLAAETIC